MATAKKTASGKWKCTVYIGTDANGKKKYKAFTDSDKRRCERMASEYVDEHRNVVASDTVEGCMNAYMTAKTPVLSPSTIRGYKCTMRYFKLHYSAFCEAKAANVDKDMVQSLVNEMSETLSPKSIRNHTGFLSAVFDYGDYHFPKVTLPEKKKPELHIPDTDVVEKIIEASRDTDMEIPVLLASFGPLRRGEICGLTIEDISGDIIHVKRSVVVSDDYKCVSKAPKTYDSDRYIPMQHYIIEKIMKQGFVTDIENPNGITSRFARIVKKLGYPGIRFHDLRHWCASYLHAQGVPDQYILSRGGWHTDHVLKAVYRHELTSERNKWNKAINDGFATLLH